MTDREADDLSHEQIQQLLLDSENISEFLNVFTVNLARTISDNRNEVYCSVTLLRPKRTTPTASSHELLEDLDELQFHHGDGPCLTAARDKQVVYVPDTRSDTRWPEYGKAAAEMGTYSILGVPMELESGAAAGLDVYATRPRAFDVPAVELIEQEVAAVSSALRLALRLESQRDVEKDLTAAINSRTVINLAVGIVMGQNRCSQGEAVDILTAASNHRNIKLRDLAAELVAKMGGGPGRTHFER
ncbi:response regulator receiver protein [Kocuria sp. WRN011]|uniref:GAF and ANTAR domain-containing protein n=1 Tax=Kocuria carniphila TaxID=262208 RepID=A0ABV3V0Q6_9MICC|nr:GAF and ANTAR domain-containing protein [Kocuria sp. WRN011]PBB09597.1 response regulator receiver protein [Kocuria sp. WRN011]